MTVAEPLRGSLTDTKNLPWKPGCMGYALRSRAIAQSIPRSSPWTDVRGIVCRTARQGAARMVALMRVDRDTLDAFSGLL
jgi:hypothetical protein